MLSFDEEVEGEEVEGGDPEEEEAAPTNLSTAQKRIARATETDEIPILIRLVNMRVDPITLGLHGNPFIPVPVFLALRSMVHAELFMNEKATVLKKLQKTLKAPLREIRQSPAYLAVRKYVLEAIDYVSNVEGINDAARKFEPHIARSMAAEAFAGGKEGNKVLLDLADRAAPKPQRANNNKVVYILPGNSAESLAELQKLAEGGLVEAGEIDGGVLNVPRVLEE